MRKCTVCGTTWHGEAARCPLDGGELVPLQGAPPEPAVLEPGQRFGSYLLGRLLSQRDRVRVFEAVHEISSRVVWLRMLLQPRVDEMDPLGAAVTAGPDPRRPDRPTVARCGMHEGIAYVAFEPYGEPDLEWLVEFGEKNDRPPDLLEPGMGVFGILPGDPVGTIVLRWGWAYSPAYGNTYRDLKQDFQLLYDGAPLSLSGGGSQAPESRLAAFAEPTRRTGALVFHRVGDGRWTTVQQYFDSHHLGWTSGPIRWTFDAPSRHLRAHLDLTFDPD